MLTPPRRMKRRHYCPGSQPSSWTAKCELLHVGMFRRGHRSLSRRTLKNPTAQRRMTKYGQRGKNTDDMQTPARTMSQRRECDLRYSHPHETWRPYTCSCDVGMKLHKPPQIIAVALALGISLSWPIPSRAQSPESQAKPDNTKVNKRDRNPDEATADRQKMNAADRNLTAEIRKVGHGRQGALHLRPQRQDHQSNGTVTLKGPVRSDVEGSPQGQGRGSGG